MLFRVQGKQARNENGMTLPEVLVSTVVMGTIMAGLLSALSVVTRVAGPTTDRLEESGDIKFLQTYIPYDLSSATIINVEPVAQPLPGLTLAGTNVLALSRVEAGATVLIDYRYEQINGTWYLVRYEVGDPTNGGVLTRVLVADAVAVPPADWSFDEKPVHAAAIISRNPNILLPIGADMLVTFESGETFASGGTGLASEEHLPPYGSRGPGAEIAPASRCGGTITLVLDNSGSIADQNGDDALKSAAVSFVDAFTGTPSKMSVFKFSSTAAPLYPTGTTGAYVDLLSPSSQITSMKSAINSLTFSGYTNWEDGLYRAYRLSTGNPRPELSDLVVFLTDGDPNTIRGGSAGGASSTTATSKALDQANYGRGLGSRVIGVLVGDTATVTASVNRLKTVVGTTVWNGSVPGNADIAQYYSPSGGAFGNLGPVFKAIMAGECGGTVTVQKFIEDAGGNQSAPTGSTWFTSETGVLEFDPTLDDSVTFDYAFPATVAREVQIVEDPLPGFTLNRVDCMKNGVAMPGADVRMAPAGTPGVIVKVGPSDAISCSFISTVTP
jgi:prepilin-type N-terminal cleavage/methylation domain-containing protein